MKVSRFHAELNYDIKEYAFYLIDKDSTNRTFRYCQGWSITSYPPGERVFSPKEVERFSEERKRWCYRPCKLENMDELYFGSYGPLIFREEQ